MIEQSFNYRDSLVEEMTDFFETREENLEPRDDRKKPSTESKKKKEKKSLKKRKREESNSIVKESSG